MHGRSPLPPRQAQLVQHVLQVECSLPDAVRQHMHQLLLPPLGQLDTA